jgi:phosphatidate cytidylyltransferase
MFPITGYLIPTQNVGRRGLANRIGVEQHASFFMLRWRLILGTLFIAALVGLCWLDHLAPEHGLFPGVYLLPLGILLVVLASGELSGLLETGGLKPHKGIVFGGNILLFTGAWLPLAWAGISALTPPPYAGKMIGLAPNVFAGSLVIFAGCVLAAFWSEVSRYEKPGGNLANLAATIFALSYIGTMFFFIAQLRMAWGIGALASLAVVVKMGDVGAYTIGRLMGRHKMAPRLSPGKTLEGAAGAILFACLGAWLIFHYVLPVLEQPNSHASISGGWAIYGTVLGIVGLFGDLAESFIKRDVGRKDSSTWMPGFGGVLDILDSLLLTAPVAWFCWAWGIV